VRELRVRYLRMPTTTDSSIEILRVDPLAHADAIKALFAAEGRVEFADYFDRAFPDAVREGARSWIGIDSKGALLMHVAVFPQRFQTVDGTAVGGLLVNLLCAREQRSFFPSLALMRRLVADTRTEGTIDFLYGDPNEQARRLVQIAGLKPVGELERFVLPLRGNSLPADVMVRLYHLGHHLRSWRRTAKARRVDAAIFDPRMIEVPRASPGVLRPYRSASLFRRRLADFPSTDDVWFTVSTPTGSAGAAVRRAKDGSAVLCALRQDDTMSLSEVVPAIVSPLRDAGHDKLWLWTLARTRFATELTRVGFVQRRERIPVLGLALNPLGERTLAAIDSWETTHLDFDR